MRPPPCFDDRETKKMLETLCADNQIDMQLLIELCDIVHGYSGSGRSVGVTSDITQSLDAFAQRSARTIR